jgi:hypothetical protein
MIQTGYDGPRRSLVDRAIAAARLDPGVFEEVEADKSATSQAAIIVLVVAIAQGIGSYSGGTTAIIGNVIGAGVTWVIWSAITYFIGSAIFKGTADLGELMRTLGFAQSAGVLYVLRVIPILGWLVYLIVAIWIVVAGVIAIRQALDISTGKAIATAVIGFLVVAIPLAVFNGLLVALM